MDTNDPFLTAQLITYLGNKRSLLPFLGRGVEHVQEKLGKKKLRILDGFSGSGVVSRLLKTQATFLWANDLEDYCEVLNKCYLANRSEVDLEDIKKTAALLEARKLEGRESPGFIEKKIMPRRTMRISAPANVCSIRTATPKFSII